MPKTCESWLGLVNSCVYFARKIREIDQVPPYSVYFKAPVELWNPLGKIVSRKCRFISNERSVKIWNDHKT